MQKQPSLTLAKILTSYTYTYIILHSLWIRQEKYNYFQLAGRAACRDQKRKKSLNLNFFPAIFPTEDKKKCQILCNICVTKTEEK